MNLAKPLGHQVPLTRWIRKVVGLSAAGLLLTSVAIAQTRATINGFVTDRSDGSPLAGATVVLFAQADSSLAPEPRYGVSSNKDGLFLISKIQPGPYYLRVSVIGFEAYADTLDLEPGEVRTVNVALRPSVERMGEVVVESERSHGAANVTAGQQTIRPEEIELVPAPDISADLVSYLSTLPGTVSTGDRGGQFFVRGGEPSQNLVLLDGMVVYQPFHVLGFYSAFPAEIIQQTDLYAGGFGSRYAGRLSSVLDVSARPGNNRRITGMASISPFLAATRLEGPLIPGRLSFLASARESVIERGAERLIQEDLPFRFGDAFAKVQGALTRTSTASVTALRTHDRGILGQDLGGVPPEEISWTNTGLGGRILLIPRFLPVAVDLNLSRSALQSELGPQDIPVRTSSIRNTRLALDARFFGSRTSTDAGLEFITYNLFNVLGGWFQNTEDEHTGLTETALYVEPEFDLGRGLQLRPGARLQFYNIRFDPYVEPRLRAVWKRGIHQISGAAGLYQQEVVGLTDRRDAASIFTVWTRIPRRDQRGDVRAGRIGRALHVLLGYRSAPAEWVEFSMEAFSKQITNLFIGEWTAFPRLTTRLQPASGRSMGLETRVEIRLKPIYAYVNYGLSSTIYKAEDVQVVTINGTEPLRFRPPHDRRHQINAVLSSSVGKFDVSARWEFGSGFPFNQAIAFDGFALVDDVRSAFDLSWSRRVVYDRPYGGVLPTYHRLDLSIERTFRIPGAALTLQGSAVNTYDRRNLYYLDIFTLRRADQLPFVPSFGLKVVTE